MKVQNTFNILLFSFGFFAFSLCSVQGHQNTGKNPKPPIGPVAKIAFGSCNKTNQDQSYWQYIASVNPDLWIWLGDMVYADTEDMTQMAAIYSTQKRNPNYYSFTQKIPVLGIWDDHDFGVNDGDKTYPAKEKSRELLLSFLDIDAENEVWTHTGVYQSYRLSSDEHFIKVILLDCRYFRDQLKPGSAGAQRYQPNLTGSILGEKQWKWLEHEIQDSLADFILIGSGIQVIPDQHPFEKWANFPQERMRLFDIIQTYVKVPVIIISGDRHLAEVSKFELDSLMYPIYEITSSGLTHSFENPGDEPNPYRVSPLYPGKNFGVLEFSWIQDTIRVTASVLSLDERQSKINWKWDYYPE